MTAHAAEWAGAERFFVSPDGSPMRGNAVYRAFARARTKVGLPGLSFHDLRHKGQTLAEMSGVAADASFDKISERFLPATSSFGADHGLGS